MNHEFKIRLTKSGREFDVPADRSAADVLVDAGYTIDLKCSDGICGVCKCGVVSGDIEHPGFRFVEKQRETQVILCQSRAAEKDGVIEIDL